MCTHKEDQQRAALGALALLSLAAPVTKMILAVVMMSMSTFPYVSFMGKILANYSYVNLSEVVKMPQRSSVSD